MLNSENNKGIKSLKILTSKYDRGKQLYATQIGKKVEKSLFFPVLAGIPCAE
jgi:hypothetical protein